MTERRTPALVLWAFVALLVAGGCSNSNNPVVAEASVATGGLAAGNDAQVVAALTTAGSLVTGWQIENARLPSAAEFAAIPGASSNGGATVAYQPAAAGFCLTATSSGKPAVTRVWRDPGGLQPKGATC